jgi:trigger factor
MPLQEKSRVAEAVPSGQLNPCLREIAVEVPTETVEQEMQSLMQKYQKLARLPGFRKGHVPASVIRQRFAEELRSDLIEELVPKFFRKEAEQQHLEPVSSPRVTDIKFSEGEPLRFKASFEVMPPIEVSGYQDLRAEKADVKVSDEDVETELNNLREQRAKFTTIEGSKLAEGDYAEVAFSGMPNEEGAKPITVDDVLVEVGGANTVREFSQNLRGLSTGEERRFDVTYPQDFNDQRLAGKTVTYNLKVKAVKQKELPPLDDEFAKALGDFESVAALRSRVREELESQKKRRAEHEAKDKLILALVEKNQFPVPEALVERQVDVRLERGLRALAAQGLRAEDMKKMDLPRLRAGQREAALNEVKASLILEKIAEAEKIEVGDQELNQEIETLAAQLRQTPEAVRARLTREGALDRIRNRIRNEKALDFLYRRSA